MGSRIQDGVHQSKGQNLTTPTFSESVQTWMALGMRRAVFSLVMEQISFKRTVSWHPHGDRVPRKRGHQYNRQRASSSCQNKTNPSSHTSGPGRVQFRGHLMPQRSCTKKQLDFSLQPWVPRFYSLIHGQRTCHYCYLHLSYLSLSYF